MNQTITNKEEELVNVDEVGITTLEVEPMGYMKKGIKSFYTNNKYYINKFRRMFRSHLKYKRIKDIWLIPTTELVQIWINYKMVGLISHETYVNVIKTLYPSYKNDDYTYIVVEDNKRGD